MSASTSDPGEPGLRDLGRRSRSSCLCSIVARSGEWLPCSHDEARLIVALFLVWLHRMFGAENRWRPRRGWGCPVRWHWPLEHKRRWLSIGSAIFASRTSRMSGSAAAHETHSAQETAVNHMSTPAESNATYDAQGGFDYFHDEHQEERQVDQA